MSGTNWVVNPFRGLLTRRLDLPGYFR